VELLPWDTQFFGLAIGRTHLARPEALESEIAAAQQNGVDCLYIVIPEAGSEAVGAAMRTGSVLTGLRLGLEHRGDGSMTEPSSVRTATPKEAARVVELAVALSASSRFAQDPRFPTERIEEMYRVWALQDLHEGGVFVDAKGEGGMLALSRHAETVAVDLVYVDDAARGSGVARALLDAAVASAAGGIVTVATDVRNVPAVRLYEWAGFRVRSLDAILHLWLDDLG
jgi:GNAT superfamily N-acetyltransferase